MVMCDKENEARQYKLLNTAFEINLSTPCNDFIANAILHDIDCSEIQSKNNLSFLEHIESYVNSYVRQSELDYKKNNDFSGDPDCGCDYDCECSLNVFVMSAFKNIARNFVLYADDNDLVNEILDRYVIEEKNRLLDCNLTEILRIILYRCLSCLAYDLGFYHVSCKHHELAILIYGGALTNASFDDISYMETVVSTIGKKAADKRWLKHNQTRPEKKKQYLQIMDQQNFTTFAETAEYIKQNIETGKKPSYDSIKRWLSEARKGDFS